MNYLNIKIKYIDIISKTIGIQSVYIELIIQTIIMILLLKTIQKIGTTLIKRTLNNKKEYTYTQKYILIIKIITIFLVILIWGRYLKDIITLISIISAAFTIALRDIIFNFFSGIYIRIVKPFELEDRIEINEYKGDVINIKALNFELLEVNNTSFTGQSTGIIINVPNSSIFNYPLRNYNKAFKYIWNEITVKVPLDCDLNKTKSILYKIVNSNEIIKTIPKKMKNQINNVANNYRIYYNHYEPIIYTGIVDDHIELQIRYLIHPKKNRYVESTIWNSILKSYQNKEIELYQK